MAPLDELPLRGGVLTPHASDSACWVRAEGETKHENQLGQIHTYRSISLMIPSGLVAMRSPRSQTLDITPLTPKKATIPRAKSR